MTTPESAVYRGQEGTGLAQIFGTEGNPLRPIMAMVANKQRKEAMEEERKRQAKGERDKRVFEMMNVDPEKTFEPFNQQLLKKAADHRRAVGQLLNNPNIDDRDPRVMDFVKDGWGQVNDYARRGMFIKERLGETLQQIKDNPYTAGNARYYNDKLNDLYMDEHGNGLDLEKVDVNKIQNIVQDNPDGFDMNKYAGDFMKNVKENVYNFTKQKYDNYGLQHEDMDVKIRGELYNPDPTTKSGVAEDKYGNPLINATPAFMNSFMSSDGARRFVMKKMEENPGWDEKRIIEEFVRPQGGHEATTQTQFRQNPEWYYNMQRGHKFGIGYKDEQAATDRWMKIKAIVNAFDEDGNINPDGRAALGEIRRNTKISGADVVDAEFIPGTNQPGDNDVLGMRVPNTAYDRVVFKTKRSGDRREKHVSFNLDDEGSMAELNGLMEQAKAEGGRHFSVDQLQGFHGETWKDLKNGRVRKTQSKEQIKELENEQVSKWSEGNDMEGLSGRMHDGKKIANAKMNVKKGLFKNTNEGIDIEYEDGTFGEIPLDYNSLASVYNGTSKTRLQAPKVKTIKRADVPAKAQAAGYSVEEYEKLLEQNGVEIE